MKSKKSSDIILRRDDTPLNGKNILQKRTYRNLLKTWTIVQILLKYGKKGSREDGQDLKNSDFPG